MLLLIALVVKVAHHMRGGGGKGVISRVRARTRSGLRFIFVFCMGTCLCHTMWCCVMLRSTVM